MANGQSAAAAAANIFKVPELKEKILFTLLCLAIYRLGSHITTPGVDVVALQTLAGQLQGTIFGIYDLFVGGGLQRATILALGIMPYISASILFQLLATVVPTVEKLQKEGEEGRKKIIQLCKTNKISVYEKNFIVDDILNADEAFVTGTFSGVIPVIFLDKKMINNGKRGKMTKRLFDLYKSEINKLYPSK